MMSVADKAHLLRFLHAPCFGLSPSQIMEIERVIDRAAVVNRKHERVYYTYDEALEILGYRSVESIRNQAKAGSLMLYVPPGHERAVGVTRASLDRFINGEQVDKVAHGNGRERSMSAIPRRGPGGGGEIPPPALF